MKKKTDKNSYRKGRMSDVINALCEAYELDKGQVNAFLHMNFPILYDKAKCANCEASMMEYIFTVSQLDADLLCTMAQTLEKRLKGGMKFTDANKIHHTEIHNYTLASRFTIASKLGLVAKVMNKDKSGGMKHDVKAGWLITRRGFEFLANSPVPRIVKVFRNEIQERFEEYTTLSHLYKEDKERVESISKISGVLLSGYHNQQLF